MPVYDTLGGEGRPSWATETLLDLGEVEGLGSVSEILSQIDWLTDGRGGVPKPDEGPRVPKRFGVGRKSDGVFNKFE